MKISDLQGDIDVVSHPTGGFSIDQRGAKPTLSQIQASLGISQSILDKNRVFQTPLTRFAQGDSQGAMDVAIGAGKQALSDISRAGAQYAGPVGAGMLRNAPEFAKNIQSFEQAVQPANLAQSQGAMMTTIGEMIAPLPKAAGATSPIVPGLVKKTGESLKGMGKSLYQFLIPRSKREAQLLQAYKAKTPLLERFKIAVKGAPTKGPRTVAETAFEKGLKGTESSMGVQASRASDEIWDKVISPRLKESTEEIDMTSFLDELGKTIVKETPEMSRQKSLLEGLNALKEDYKNVGKISLEQLQDIKSGWAEFIPEKSYQGKSIAGAFKEVTAKAADKARTKIYESLGDDVKEAYLDYGNLKALKELGQNAMTGGRLKGGFGGFWSAIKDMALTPVATISGRVIYKVGEGIEVVGEKGAKTLADLVFFRSLAPTLEDTSTIER